MSIIEKQLLNPKIDYVFKRIFGRVGNEEITTALIQAITKTKISDLKLDNSTILERDIIDDKIGILDIKGKIDNNINCNIEMQVADRKNAEKRKNRMTALLMALILCVGMVSGTNKEVRAQSASQNSETQTASESDVTTENTANIAENTTKSAVTVTHYEYTTEEVKESIQGIFEWAKSLTNADELIDKTFLEGADTSLNDWFAFAAAHFTIANAFT